MPADSVDSEANAPLSHTTNAEVLRRVLAPTVSASAPSAAQDDDDEGGGVFFLRSFTDDQKRELLERAYTVLYTPSNEHFGIVPVESMAIEVPVVAVASGGPCESIDDGETGLLCSPDAVSFRKAMERLIYQPDETLQMGIKGRERVQRLFSRSAFEKRLDALCCRLVYADAGSNPALTGLHLRLWVYLASTLAHTIVLPLSVLLAMRYAGAR